MSTLQKINLKLTKDINKYWHAKALFIICVYELDDQLTGLVSCPSHFFIVENDACGSSIKQQNPKYHKWKKLDKLLMSQLIVSLFENMFSDVARCTTTQKIWSTLETFFVAESESQSVKYKKHIANNEKSSLTKHKHFRKVKDVVDALMVNSQNVT